MLGDFGSSPQSLELEILRKEKLCALIPSSQFTNISTRSPQGTQCLDNIWVSRSLRKSFSGRLVFPQRRKFQLLKSSGYSNVYVDRGGVLRLTSECDDVTRNFAVSQKLRTVHNYLCYPPQASTALTS